MPSNTVGSSGGDRRVLIVDDEVDVAESLGDILIGRGYRVETAGTIQQALASVDRFDADVALLDIRLGTENGLDLIAPLKRRRPNIICIMMTAHAEAETAIGALRSGAYDYLSKPMRPAYVLATLDRCFDNLRLKREAESATVVMRRAMETADTANRAKSEFLAAMSHELRTPLNAVIGFSEMIRNQVIGPIGNAKYIEYADDINESGTHLLGLINDILDIAKIEAGKLDLFEEPVDVAEAIRACFTLVKERAKAGGLELEAEVPSDLPVLHADERKVKQILLNLLSNAVKFTPEGGTVTVTVTAGKGRGILIQVIDTGIGMAPDEIPRALTRFSQIDSALNRKYNGTGLGLSLTKALIELHGGTLELESVPGNGTTATVRFPPERLESRSESAA